MSWKKHTITIKGWPDFVSFVHHLTWDATIRTNEWYFRGQSCADWGLESSLSRLIKGLIKGYDDSAYDIDTRLLDSFRTKTRSFLPTHHLPPEEDIINWWIMMQHYRAPTRLLDWTASPYVAAYFAVVENPTCDGVVWGFSKIIFEMYANNKQWKLPASGTLEYLKQYAGIDALFPITGAILPERMIIQQGMFTLCSNIRTDYADVIEKICEPASIDGLFKLIIPKAIKHEALVHLHSANISAASLFPGIDGIGASTAEEARLIIETGREITNMFKKYQKKKDIGGAKKTDGGDVR
jgi:hypothetical protein